MTCYTEDDNGNTGTQNRNIVGAWKANTKWQNAVSKSSEITEFIMHLQYINTKSSATHLSNIYFSILCRNR